MQLVALCYQECSSWYFLTFYGPARSTAQPDNIIVGRAQFMWVSNIWATQSTAQSMLRMVAGAWLSVAAAWNCQVCTVWRNSSPGPTRAKQSVSLVRFAMRRWWFATNKAAAPSSRLSLPVSELQLETKAIRRFIITEKAPTRPFS